jgi:hypothetical protein
MSVRSPRGYLSDEKTLGANKIIGRVLVEDLARTDTIFEGEPDVGENTSLNALPSR